MEYRGNSLAQHGSNILRGILMGGADIVPGVSGGTVALILGVYERLVTAISHFDVRFLKLVWRRRWLQAALHIDLPFLIPLATGVLLGFVIMTVLMHHLLSTQETRSLTMALFFGLICASGVLVALMIRPQTAWQFVRCLIVGLSGVALAWWLAGANAVNASSPSLAFIFASGAIAICAMILPGISGAMILLILGVYIHLTEIPSNIVRGDQIAEGVLTVLVFATGCALGLVTFSKVLRWLLAKYHAVTMALLCGFMFGSLRKLWPFQIDQSPDIEKIKFKTFEPYMPSEIDGHFLAVVTVALLAIAFVFAIDWFTHGHLRRLFKTDS